MVKPTIIIATNLKVWSMAIKTGAPSFYKTIELYWKHGFNVILFTTERKLKLPEFPGIVIYHMPKIDLSTRHKGYSLRRLIIYLMYQIIFLMYYFIHPVKFDLSYGYEIEFIPALRLLSILLRKPLVTRFQGTILTPLIKKSNWRIRQFPHYLSILIRPNLTIMTDDGTKGDLVIKKIRGNTNNVLFLKNGLDFNEPIKSFNADSHNSTLIEMKKVRYVFITVSRLEQWKRVDKSIDVFRRVHEVIKETRLFIIGDGSVRRELEIYVKDSGLCDSVFFLGGIETSDVQHLLRRADFFLSHYDISNVGNPLFEAMANDCVIVTQMNGATGEIIEDGNSGIISNEHDYLKNAEKIISLLKHEHSQKKIDSMKSAAKCKLKSLLVSWDKRMQIELAEIKKIIGKADSDDLYIAQN